MRYPEVIAALASGALALSLGLAGCGGSGQLETEVAAEFTVDESATEATSEIFEAGYEWSNCYMGLGESDAIFIYAEDQRDAENPAALMIVLNPDTVEYICFVGPVSNLGETQVTIEDGSTGNTLTFEVEAAEDGKVLVDLGETGKAVLSECTSDDINEAIEVIGTYGEALA